MSSVKPYDGPHDIAFKLVDSVYIQMTKSMCGFPQVLYSLYVPVGPWFAARFLSSQPLGLFLSQGVMLSPNAETSWRWLPCADTSILANRFTFFTLLPGTLWLAGVVSHW